MSPGDLRAGALVDVGDDTRAASAAQRSAVARPMPFAPPVMMTTSPSRSPAIISRANGASSDDRRPCSSVDEYTSPTDEQRKARARIPYAMHLERLAGILAMWPPAAVIMMLNNISWYVRTDEAFGVELGREETVELVERHIRALEGERAETPSTPVRKR
jgi:hypothetical protein